jgi:hypothetical protein
VSVLDLLYHLPDDKKQELAKLNDQIMELAGHCKRPADHRKLNALLKRQGEILGWREET